MKKRLVIGIVIIIFVIGGIGAFFLWQLKQKTPTSSFTQPQPQTSSIEEETVWKDQAGFSFTYPKALSFDKHDEDQVNYAHIEFTSATHSGRLIVWAKDTTYPDVSAWVTKDKNVQGATNVDTTLGGQPAKKILLLTPSKKSIIGTISDQILFTIEAEPTEGDDYWTKVSDSIASSFAFTPADTSAASATSPDDAGPAIDEEEVVE